MVQTKEGAKKAMEAIRAKYGDDFHKNIGSIGGKKGAADGTIKGFALMTPEKRKAAGALGGKKSRKNNANK